MTLAAAAAASLSLGVGQAMAGCGSPDTGVAPPQSWLAAPGNLPWHESVVGLWKVTFTSDGSAYPTPIPAGVVTDFGTVQWHSDGNEIMVSGGRAPSTGDVCMGVWKKIGFKTFKLNHLALAWVSSDTPPPAGPVSPAQYLGPAVFSETVTLNLSGNGYEGPFTIDQYAVDGTTLIEHIGGTVKATRVMVD
jgi:hypothetical protein